jgi:ribosomal protein L16/L10AE
VAVVKPGRVMFEIAGVTEEIAREALRPCGTQAADQVQDRSKLKRKPKKWW